VAVPAATYDRAVHRVLWFLLALQFIAICSCAPEVPAWSDVDRALVASGPTDNPFVHANGTALVDGNGDRLKLRGYNLGAWLLWEGWMMGGGWSLHGETTMMGRLADVVGDTDADAFREEFRARFITEEDIRRMAESGANVVRVGLNHNVLENDDADHTPREAGYALFDDLLLWCEQHGVRVVFDLHAAPGGQSSAFMADPEDEKLWDSVDKQDRTVALWREIAVRYRDNDTIAGYDLLNEPDAPDPETLLAFYQRLAEAIRDIDPLHMIIVEGTNVAGELKEFTRAITWNQVYSVHQYGFFGDWRTSELERWTAVSTEHQVPLWVGEFGLSDASDIQRSVELYNDDDNIAGYALWAWKEIHDEDDMPLIVSGAPDEWYKLARYMNGNWSKPTVQEARIGMSGVLDALAPSECTEREDVLDVVSP
jgi:endoglucanase